MKLIRQNSEKQAAKLDAKMTKVDALKEAYIQRVRGMMEEKLQALFGENSRVVVRSMMAKLLAAMPIFMNTTDEIKSYFDYVLGSVSDASELSATAKLINDIIEDE